MGKYNWTYTYVGGVPRVKIATGEDIAHLDELDQKMWTVLSCPVKGLEIAEKSLQYMDTNKDGNIHVEEVIATVNWLKAALKDLNVLLEGKDTLPLSALNSETAEGKQLYNAAKTILTSLGKDDATEISLADSSSSLDSFLKEKLEALKAEVAKINEVKAPFGDDTDAIDAAYQALDAKISDYFLRAKLSAFATESTAALDVQVSRIEAISADNLTGKSAEIASYPIARITGKAELALDAAINPAWSAAFNTVKKAFEGETAITETLWAEAGAKIKAYRDYQASITVNEGDIKLDDELAQKQLVDKLLHLNRDFFTLLKNFVTLHDFYSKDFKGIFQAGTLFIDQRECELCVKVNDAGVMAATANQSGMFLVFCDCVSKVKGETMKIIAAVTAGDIRNITPGKNCIFYDRNGHDWDAKVTSVIDNPISIKQAMWSPYHKFGKFVEEQINKFAAEKESGVLNDATSKFNSSTEAVKENTPTDEANAASAKDAGKAAASSFDIAKFCGIFAAIGMALGYIGSFLVSIATGFISLKWWQMPLSILAIMLIISGPSMFIAWMKLRKRNLSPILNANGWAVNAAAKINITFGNSLTKLAKFPLSASMKRQDPFADKGMSIWTKLLIILIVILAIVAAAEWYFGLGIMNYITTLIG